MPRPSAAPRAHVASGAADGPRARVTPAWLALAAALAASPAGARAPAPTDARADSPAAKPKPEGPAPEVPPPISTTEPTAVPKIPSPRSMPPPTGPSGPGSGDRLGELGLTRQQDGTAVYVDPGRRFTAALNPDGTVRFGDRWGRDQYGRRMRGSGWSLRQIGINGIGIGGPAEWLLGLQDRMGGPERHAAAKREFLAKTAEVRTAMAVAWTMELLQYRLKTLEQELFDLWNAPGQAPAARRELLFQRWDECAEAYAAVRPAGEITPEAESAIDQARVETAEKARRTIEAFVRRQLPRGSASAYTRAELADMNRRRRSVQPFAPYDERPKP